jgi:hypothetical protein
VLLQDVDAVGVGQYLYKFVVGDKVEAGEESAFDLEVVLKFLLNLLEQLQVASEVLEVGVLDEASDEGLSNGLLGEILEELVALLEVTGLHHQLLLYVLGSEDVLQVHPLLLALHQLLHYLLRQ